MFLQTQVWVYPDGVEYTNTTVLPIVWQRIRGIPAHAVSVPGPAPTLISSYFNVTREKHIRSTGASISHSKSQICKNTCTQGHTRTLTLSLATKFWEKSITCVTMKYWDDIHSVFTPVPEEPLRVWSKTNWNCCSPPVCLGGFWISPRSCPAIINLQGNYVFDREGLLRFT